MIAKNSRIIVTFLKRSDLEVLFLQNGYFKNANVTFMSHFSAK